MAIEDYIANPKVAPIAQMWGQGIADRQQRRANNMDFLIKQLGYQEALADREISGMERQYKRGKLSFDLDKQSERMERDYAQESLNKDMAMKEQLIRGLNNPNTYAGYADAYKSVLSPDFFDKDGNILPFEATTRQRTALTKMAIDSTEHIRDKELTEIRATMGGSPGYSSGDVTGFQRDAAFDFTNKLIKDLDLKIGKLSGKEPNDAKILWRTTAELPAQIAAKLAKQGVVPNENSIRTKLGEFAKEARKPNPKNKGLSRLTENDEMIDWEVYNRLVSQEYGVDASYLIPQVSVSAPAFMFKTDDATGLPKITSEDEYNKLEPGQEYIDPNGKRKRKRKE